MALETNPVQAPAAHEITDGPGGMAVDGIPVRPVQPTTPAIMRAIMRARPTVRWPVAPAIEATLGLMSNHP